MSRKAKSPEVVSQIQQWCEEGVLSMAEMAEKLGYTYTGVYQIIKKHEFHFKRKHYDALSERGRARDEKLDRIRAFCADGATSISEMARIMGCSASSISILIERYGIEYKRDAADAARERFQREREEKWPKLLDEAWFRKQHDKDGKTLEEIAKMVGCSVGTVVRARDGFGITPHKYGYSKKRTRRRSEITELNDGDWLRKRLVDEGKSCSEVGAELRCSPSHVGKAARRHRIDCVVVGERMSSRLLAYPLLANPEWLREQYITKDRKAQELAEELGCSVFSVQEALGKFRILKHPARPREKLDKSLPKGTIRKDGYLLVFTPEHPCANGKGYVMQHRLIVEKIIGRHLDPQEEVHHINFNRSDNREANLIVMPNFKAHRHIENNPPPWIPRCPCCGESRPKQVTGRPSWVPLVYDAEATYSLGPPPEYTGPEGI